MMTMMEHKMKPELKAKVEELAPKPRAWPKLVCDHGKIVADCVVIVAEWDFNWWRTNAWSRDGELTVRRDTLRDRAAQLVLQMSRRV
jgi:hypothetical protein